MIEVRLDPPARVEELERWCREKNYTFELQTPAGKGGMIERLTFRNNLHALSFCQDWPAEIVRSY